MNVFERLPFPPRHTPEPWELTPDGKIIKKGSPQDHIATLGNRGDTFEDCFTNTDLEGSRVQAAANGRLLTEATALNRHLAYFFPVLLALRDGKPVQWTPEMIEKVAEVAVTLTNVAYEHSTFTLAPAPAPPPNSND